MSDDDDDDDEDDSEYEERLQEEAERRQKEHRRQVEQRAREEARRQEEQRAQEERRRRRHSTIYHDNNDAILVTERPPRRRTDASIQRNEYHLGKDAATTRALDSVEAYQQKIRGSDQPLSEQVHKVAKQRALRGPTESDRKTRISQSNRTAVTNGNSNGEIRLRVDASAPLSLAFNGDMEGRTLQINPTEDGMADIIIGGQRGEDDVYRSEKGSARGNRNSMSAGSARREAEEVSVRSGRSSQGRRDREVESRRERDRDVDRRPLRRQAQTRYNY